MKRLIKIVLSFTFVLAVAFLLWGIGSRLKSHQSMQRQPAPAANLAVNAASEDKRRTPVAELHVLSTNMNDENVMYVDGGRKKTADVKILFPPNSQYTQAVARPGKQGVLQLSVKFEADGTVSEITPLAR